MAADDMSFPNFMTVKNHCTEHASDISQTFRTKPADYTGLFLPCQVLPLMLNVQPYMLTYLISCAFPLVPYSSCNLLSHGPNAPIPHHTFPHQVHI